MKCYTKDRPFEEMVPYCHGLGFHIVDNVVYLGMTGGRLGINDVSIIGYVLEDQVYIRGSGTVEAYLLRKGALPLPKWVTDEIK